MPQPTLPLTPASSSDIKGQDGTTQLSPLQLTFELPPPAIHEVGVRSSSTLDAQVSTTTKAPPNPNAYRMQAAEAVKYRRRSSAAVAAAAVKKTSKATEASASSFALPPPPTRSRKIIQMKPRPQGADATETQLAKEPTRGSGKPAAASAASLATKSTSHASGSGSGTQAKRKAPSATSAVGRKMARKTAHSLIERRRRGKMNEEFSLLKSMIPACTGEMHKLAILQASIEYVRYLQDCVSKLQAQRDKDHEGQSPTGGQHSIAQFHPTFHNDLSGDVDMTDSEAVSPAFTAQPDYARVPSTSPALRPQDADYRHRNRQHSYSSVSTDNRHYGFVPSASTSPAFGPQHHEGRGPAGPLSMSGSILTSPALNPQSDLDQEATAALLMLNSDRRGAVSGRGLSVRDLLST